MFRKITLSAAIVALAATASMAEVITPTGFHIKDGNAKIVLNDPSTLVVNIDVECERTEVGIYARYAQKHFGIRASLVEKESYKIVGADISLAPTDFYVAGDDAMRSDSYVEELSSTTTRLPIDIQSSDLLPVEEAAEEAANAIFTIRQLRRDLISGELGEGFYSGGLAAALDRLQWEEEQYAELFFGRTTRSRSSHTCYVPLDGTTVRYIVARFSAKTGVCPTTDLAAEPLVLQLSPSEPRNIEVPPITDKSLIIKFWVENRVDCKLSYGSKQLTNKMMPLSEFGEEIQYPVSYR